MNDMYNNDQISTYLSIFQEIRELNPKSKLLYHFPYWQMNIMIFGFMPRKQNTAIDIISPKYLSFLRKRKKDNQKMSCKTLVFENIMQAKKIYGISFTWIKSIESCRQRNVLFIAWNLFSFEIASCYYSY